MSFNPGSCEYEFDGPIGNKQMTGVPGIPFREILPPNTADKTGKRPLYPMFHVFPVHRCVSNSLPKLPRS